MTHRGHKTNMGGGSADLDHRDEDTRSCAGGAVCPTCELWNCEEHMKPPSCRDRLATLLRQARQYVCDAGNDEDPETQRLSSELLVEIDAELGSCAGGASSGDDPVMSSEAANCQPYGGQAAAAGESPAHSMNTGGAVSEAEVEAGASALYQLLWPGPYMPVSYSEAMKMYRDQARAALEAAAKARKGK